MSRRARGSVILQVMVSGMILAFIAASMLRMTLQPALTSANTVKTVAAAKTAEAALNRVKAAWSLAGRTCASDSTVGVACEGEPGTCVCACRTAGLPSVLSSALPTGACTLSVTVP